MAFLSDFFRPMTTALEARTARWLCRYSVMLLRASLGIVFLAFGFLKFFPGLSPVEPLAGHTFEILTFGLIPERAGLVLVAGLESIIGLLLLTGARQRLAVSLLAFEILGIMSPIVLLPREMFRWYPFAPTLAGQYVIKDVIVAAAGLVVAARALGAKMVTE